MRTLLACVLVPLPVAVGCGGGAEQPATTTGGDAGEMIDEVAIAEFEFDPPTITVDGWQSFMLIQGTTLVVGGAVAAWMLYIQHQHEGTYYQATDEWRFELAALQGSSYLRLPRALAWVVGNANYHHVHHLSARIPNHRLSDAHEEQPMFAPTPVVTVRSGIAALRLKLWDEQHGRLVRYSARRRRRARSFRARSEAV